MNMTAEEFNALYPIGTPVRYWPVLGVPGVNESVETKTRSEAWALGHGDVVVKIEGRTGGCYIEHMEPLA